MQMKLQKILHDFLNKVLKRYFNKRDFFHELYTMFKNLNNNYLEKLDEFLDYFFSQKKTLTENFDENLNENKSKVSNIRKLIL